MAQVLRLTAIERVHLYRLTKALDTGFTCKNDATPARIVRPTVQALLDRLEPAPAVLLNRMSEILAYTAGYERLMAPIGLLDGSPPNVARFVFTDKRARTAYPDWDHVADEQVAALKQGPFRADPNMATLADELTVTTGEAFARRVNTVPGLPKSNGIMRLVHPEVSELRLAYETLELPADDDQRLIVHLPADEAASTALDRLNGRRPRALRVVSG